MSDEKHWDWKPSKIVFEIWTALAMLTTTLLFWAWLGPLAALVVVAVLAWLCATATRIEHKK